MNILYIEDDLEIGSWVQRELSEKGYTVDWLTSGVSIPSTGQWDLLILDVMLPCLDGFSVGRRFKKGSPDTPIIMLSARTSIDDKLAGLEFADDYLTKPFHPEELAKRVEVQLRRYQKNSPGKIVIKHLEIDQVNRFIGNRETGEEIVLTGKQFHIFTCFIQHLNQILTKEQLFEHVWGEPFLDGDKTLMVHIRYLREKIEKNPSEPEIIETVRGVGYRVRG
ncbi:MULTISPECIES: response regulator transcription factor [Bacillaceae]|uniref:response regulator transcription factor n=1 Tax=Bacillaceae TaxID=186817 RepID=UPI000C76ED8E|nr:MULTISPECIES: response regulator transcription factor [Bacillaceae]PLR69321.1 DNA-binding response regulator [Bacillus sp. UMB0893]QNG59210.1 response regulator transcription factor [Bacillus sp. PAMC26568]